MKSISTATPINIWHSTGENGTTRRITGCYLKYIQNNFLVFTSIGSVGGAELSLKNCTVFYLLSFKFKSCRRRSS